MLQFLLYSTVEGWRLQADGESRLLDHAPDSRSERRVGGETFEFGISVEEEHDLHTLQGRLERRRLGEVSLHQLRGAAERVACSLWIAHEGLEGHTALASNPTQGPSNLPGRP